MDSKEELPDRLWEGPGLPDTTPLPQRYKRCSSHFVDKLIAARSPTPSALPFFFIQSFVVFVKV